MHKPPKCCVPVRKKTPSPIIHALSPRTVETHKGNIFRKLGINSTAELSEIIKKIEA